MGTICELRRPPVSQVGCKLRPRGPPWRLQRHAEVPRGVEGHAGRLDDKRLSLQVDRDQMLGGHAGRRNVRRERARNRATPC